MFICWRCLIRQTEWINKSSTASFTPNIALEIVLCVARMVLISGYIWSQYMCIVCGENLWSQMHCIQLRLKFAKHDQRKTLVSVLRLCMVVAKCLHFHIRTRICVSTSNANTVYATVWCEWALNHLGSHLTYVKHLYLESLSLRFIFRMTGCDHHHQRAANQPSYVLGWMGHRVIVGE